MNGEGGMPMTQKPPTVEEITTLEEAKARIVELEKKLDEAIDIIMKRDEQLDATERRLLNLQSRLESIEGSE